MLVLFKFNRYVRLFSFRFVSLRCIVLHCTAYLKTRGGIVYTITHNLLIYYIKINIGITNSNNIHKIVLHLLKHACNWCAYGFLFQFFFLCLYFKPSDIFQSCVNVSKNGKQQRLPNNDIVIVKAGCKYIDIYTSIYRS